MKHSDPVLFRELPIIQKIIQDETWLEAERRGCYVSSDDRVVRENVCQIVLRVGQELRDSLTKGLAESTEQPALNCDRREPVTRMAMPRAGEAA